MWFVMCCENRELPRTLTDNTDKVKTNIFIKTNGFIRVVRESPWP